MDYGKLLCKAQEINKNEATKEVRCYSTKFAPPKKLERSKVSSENIKKFLARKEAEEKRKREEASKKKEELLALRSQDKKAQRRVQVMLKSTKSANKSVMEDAIDNVNTAVTLGGFKQCDEDDYGYVSQEASAFYNKLLHKYEKMPNEPSIFSKPKKEVKDLNAAKDRVKAALQREAEEELMPHKRKKRKLDSCSTEADDLSETEKEVSIEREVKLDKEAKSEKGDHKLKRKVNAPPPLKFDQLLQIAEKKQFEPILIDERKLKKEPERLLTRKEKLELEKDELRRLKKKKNPDNSSVASSNKDTKDNENKSKDYRDTSQRKSIKSTTEKLNKNLSNDDHAIKNEIIPKKEMKIKSDSNKYGLSSKEKLNGDAAIERLKKDSSVWKKNLSGQSCSKPIEKKKINDLNRAEVVPGTSNVKSISKLPHKENKTSEVLKNNKLKEINNRGKELAPKKEMSELDKQLELIRLKKEMIAEKAKLKKFELLKMQLDKKKKKTVEKKRFHSKRRLGSESEGDSELDDFIDDGPIDDGADYSKYISEIFGYDKYKYINDDDDDECMESNFAQQMREEYVSTKIGIMEDLEDIRKEQEEKARKKLKMKKMR